MFVHEFEVNYDFEKSSWTQNTIMNTDKFQKLKKVTEFMNLKKYSEIEKKNHKFENVC